MSLDAMKQALEALENHTAIKHPQQRHYRDSAIDALRTAIEQAEQPRQWQGLTKEDLFDIASVNFGEPDLLLFVEMGKLVQKELKELNT